MALVRGGGGEGSGRWFIIEYDTEYILIYLELIPIHLRRIFLFAVGIEFDAETYNIISSMTFDRFSNRDLWSANKSANSP